jgi:hypothetical protein
MEHTNYDTQYQPIMMPTMQTITTVYDARQKPKRLSPIREITRQDESCVEV